MMDYATVLPPSGLYRELYYPSPESLSCAEGNIVDGVLDVNSVFWANILSEATVLETMRKARHVIDNTSLPIKAAINDCESFISRIAEAKIRIADQSISPQKFFSYLESLNIYCELYSQLLGTDISLTIQNGFHLKEESSKELFENCLIEDKNPYLEMIVKIVLPELRKHRPKVVFFAGRPGYFSIALARLLKAEPFNPVIIISQHSSEYYSLNKIDFLLIQNTYLFQVFDAVILEGFDTIEKDVVNAVLKGHTLSDIPNLIYRTTSGSIIHNGYRIDPQKINLPIIQKRPANSIYEFPISPEQIVNVHLFPYIKCYWNRCAFCGINKKYHFENPSNAYSKVYEQLSFLKASITHESYIWFIDEAIPPEVLTEIAQYFCTEMPWIKWQVRCRIETELLCSGLPELLSKSGLRELRLGLESGSFSVLKRMNKFDDAFSFEIVEEICKKYTDCGISVHFPIILGFPGESLEERRETYDLLRTLTEKYPLVSFNANLFGLDISSKATQNWLDYGIQEISFPCPPIHFLGNILQWQDGTTNMSILSLQRDQFMRGCLYPWLPPQPLTPPHILYRLSETIRNTLVWKGKTPCLNKIESLDISIQLQCADITIFQSQDIGVFYIYSWESHHYMIGNSHVTKLLAAFSAPCSLCEGIIAFNNSVVHQYTESELWPLISRLIYDCYLVVMN